MKQQEKQRQLNIRIDAELYALAQHKSYRKLGIGLSSLIKIFLKSFVTQKGVGFYVGDDDLCNLFARWIIKKRATGGTRGFRDYGPYLKDLYDLGNIKKSL